MADTLPQSQSPSSDKQTHSSDGAAVDASNPMYMGVQSRSSTIGPSDSPNVRSNLRSQLGGEPSTVNTPSPRVASPQEYNSLNTTDSLGSSNEFSKKRATFSLTSQQVFLLLAFVVVLGVGAVVTAVILPRQQSGSVPPARTAPQVSGDDRFDGEVPVNEFGEPQPPNTTFEQAIGVANIDENLEESQLAPIFNELTFTYAGEAEVRNLELFDHLTAVVFRVYDPDLNETIVFSSVRQFPIVPNTLPQLWLANDQEQYLRGSVGEIITETDGTVVAYFVERFEGDVTSSYHQVILSADENEQVTQPTIPFAIVDFNQEETQ